MPVIAELRAVVTADTVNFERGMRSVSIGVALAGTAMAALGVSVAALIKSGSDLQQSFQQVQANTDMTTEHMKAMEEAVVSLGARSPATFEDLAKGYMHITNFGFQAAESTKILDIAMQSAVATGTKVEATANVLAGVLHEFALSGDQASVVMNTLHHAAALGNLTLEQFVAVGGRVFSTAANMHVPLDQAAAALAALTRAGFTSQQAATQLVNVMQRIVAPTKDATDEIQRLGKASGVDLAHDFSLAGIQSKGLSGVLADLKQAAGANSDEMLKLFGRIRGGLGAMALIGNASADYNRILGELADTMSGKLTPVQDNYKLATETLAFQLGTLQNKFQLLGFELFTALGPQLTASLEVLNNVVLKTIGFIANLPPQIVAATVAFTTAVGVVGTVIVAVEGLILLLGAPMLAALVGVASAVGLMAAAFVTNFGGITSAAASWVGGMQVNFRSIAGFIGSLLDAWLVFQRLFIQGVDLVITAGRILVSGLMATTDALGGAVKAAIGFLNKDVTAVAMGITEVSTAAKFGIEDAFNQMKAFGSRFAQNAKDTAANFQGHWKNAFQGAVDSAAQFAQGVAAKGGELATAWNKSMGEVGNATDNASKKHKKAFDEMVSTINDYLRAIGAGFEINRTILDGMSANVRTSLESQAKAWEANKEAIARWNVELFQQMGVTIPQINEWLKSIGANFTLNSAILHATGPADRAIIAEQTQAYLAEKTAVDTATGALAAHWAAVSRLHPPIIQNIQDLGIMSESEKQVEASTRSFLSALAFSIPWVTAAQNIQLHKQKLEELRAAYEDVSHRIPISWNVMIDAIGKGLGKANESFLQFGLRTKEVFGEVFQLLNLFPGKLGDAFRSGLREVDRWVSLIDNALKLLHRVFDSIPAGLGDAIQKVVQIFRGASNTVASSAASMGAAAQAGTAGIVAGSAAGAAATAAMAATTASSAITVDTAWGSMASNAQTASTTIEGAAHKAGDAVDQMAKQTQTGAQKATSALGKFVGDAVQILGGFAAILAGHAQGGLAGGITGALGGFLAGAKIGSFFGPGLGTLIGGLIGGVGGFLAGIFGGGKSDLQKAQEAAQLQQAKDAITISQQQAIQAVEQTKQSMVDTASKIRDLLESITFYTQIPKDAFDAFFHDLDKLMDKFAARAQEWSGDASAKIKTFSEDMQNVVNALANVPQILNGIAAHLGVSDASIQRFFDDLGKVIVAFETLGEDFTRKFLRHTRQFAERIQEAVQLIPDITAGITGLVDIKPIPVGNFDIFETSLREITNRIGTIAENFDKFTAKLIGFFATQIGPAVTLWKDSIDAIKAMADLTPPSAEAFTTLFAGIQSVLDGMSNLANTIQTDALIRAQAIALAADSIFTTIKNAVDALTALADFKGVAPEAFQALLDGFDQAIVILNDLLTKATSFESIAIQIEDKLKSAAKHMADGVSAMAATLSSAAASLGAPAGGSTVGISSAGLTLAPGAAPSSSTTTAASSGSPIIFQPGSIVVQGSLVHQSELQDVIVNAISGASRRGRIGIGWGSAIPITV